MDEPPAVDPAWLAERLRAAGLDASFERVEAELLGRFSTEVWRLRLVGAGAERAPSLILKRPYRPARRGEPPELEGTFYERLAATLPVATPRFVGRLGKALLVTELPGLRPFDFRFPPEPEHAARAVEGLAALHAAWWERAAELEWLPKLGDPGLRRAWQVDFEAGWRRNRSRFHALCPAFTPIGDALARRLADAIEPLARPATLLHGDAHAENLPLTSEGEVAFLDWQGPRAGSPGFDLAVFTTMSYPPAERRAVEEELYERHLRALRERGVPWSGSWEAYRRGVLRRAARIVEIGAGDEPSSLDWLFERCATAAVDHRVLELVP